MRYINIIHFVLKVHLHCRLERQQGSDIAGTVLEGWTTSCASAYSLFPSQIKFYVEVTNHFESNIQFIRRDAPALWKLKKELEIVLLEAILTSRKM